MEYGYTIADRYVCRKPLGKGSNGRVFLAFDNKLCKYWAIKACSNLSEREIYALKSINHYAFPRIVDVISQDNTEFLIMDYIEGETLTNYCKCHTTNEKQVVKWCQKIASAISYLHNMNPAVFYVDCKPDNIMITPSGDIRLIDLGSIYVDNDASQEVSGTRFFAPKELAYSKPSVTSDIYSFGMTMYRLITRSNTEYRDSLGNLCPTKINKNISIPVSRLIKRCTATNINARYQSMTDVVEVLTSISHSKINISGKFASLYQMAIKCILTISIILTALFVHTYQIPIISLMFIILLALCKKPTYYSWETRKEIFKSSISTFVFMLILASTLLGNKSYAQISSPENYIKKDVPDTERLDITLYDKFNRKLLIRPGATWTIDDDISDISFSLNKDELQPGINTITITCTSDASNKSYTFKCSPD